MKRSVSSRGDGAVETSVRQRAAVYLRSLLAAGSSQPAWVDGIVVTVAFAVPLVVGVELDRLRESVVAAVVAAMLVAMTPRASWFSRRVTSLVIGVAFVVPVVVVAGFASRSAGAAAGLIALLGFVAVIAFEFGPAGGMLGALLVPLGVLLLARPTATTSEVVSSMVAAAVGGGWAIVVFVAATLFRGQRPAQQSMADAYSALAGYAGALGASVGGREAGATPAIDAARRASTRAIDASLAITATPFWSTAATREELARARALVTRAVGTHAGLLELASRAQSMSLVPADVSAAILAVGNWARALADSLRAGTPNPNTAAVVARVQAAARGAAAEPAAMENGVDGALARLGRAIGAESPVGGELWSDGSPGEVLAASVSADSLALRNAARSAIALAVAALIAELTDIKEGWWIVLSVGVLLKAGMSETVAAVSRRILGTVIGALLASGLIALVGGNTAATVAIASLLMFAMVSLRPLNYAYWVISITPLILLLLSLGAPGHGPELAGWRVLNTILGSTIVIAASYLVWPNRGAGLVRQGLSAYINTLRVYLATVRHASGDITDTVLAHRRGLLADANARTAIDGYRDEPGADASFVDWSTSVFEACRASRDNLFMLARESNEASVRPPEQALLEDADNRLLRAVAEILETTPAAAATRTANPGAGVAPCVWATWQAIRSLESIASAHPRSG